MVFIKRTGTVFSWRKFFFTFTPLSIVASKTDWGHQYIAISKSIPFLYYSEALTVILFYFLFSVVLVLFWYIISKELGPSLGVFIARMYGGVTSKAFIDKHLKFKTVSLKTYLQRYLNLFVLLFILDFLLSNSIYFASDGIPSVNAAIISVIIISIIEPQMYTLNDIGLRLWKMGSNEITSVTFILDRFVLKTLQTSSLVATLFLITKNGGIIDDIPVMIRVIFVRDIFIASLVIFLFTTFFQPEPLPREWLKRGIPEAKVNLTFYKRSV